MSESNFMYPEDDTLRALAQLPPNWDSYGAYEVTEAALESASQLMTKPRVTPSPDGGVSVTWTNEHLEVDVTILPDGTFGDVTAERFTPASPPPVPALKENDSRMSGPPYA